MAVVSYTDTGGHIVASENGDMKVSPFSKAIVSNHMGYGSYSGADVKVIVHFPHDAETKQLMRINRIKLEGELIEYDNKIGTLQRSIAAAGGTVSPSAQQSLLNERAGIVSELEKIDNSIAEINNMPTSKVLAEIQTLSWSIHREKFPVRVLGSVYPRAYTRGPRTIAGSMVFTVFHKHVLHEVLDLNLGLYSTGTSDHDSYRDTTMLPDQLPPLDISLVFANEYGAMSHMGIWGVEFLQEGGTFSIEDIFSENVVQYVARDLDPLRVAGTRKIDGHGVTKEWTKTATGLLYERQSLSDHLKRRNPFI